MICYKVHMFCTSRAAGTSAVCVISVQLEAECHIFGKLSYNWLLLSNCYVIVLRRNCMLVCFSIQVLS